VFYSLKTQTLEQHLFGAVAGERSNELIPWEITTLTVSVLDSEQEQKKPIRLTIFHLATPLKRKTG
jgi:hypothetical protein